MNEVIAIILASGKGTRYGGPKAEAEVDGVSFMDRIVATLKEAGISQILRAQNYDTPDMLATLRHAVAKIEPTKQACSGYLIFPVDFPFVSAQTVQKLAKAHFMNPEAIIRPSLFGFSGHPIIIPADLDLTANDHGKGLKGLILFSGKPVKDIMVHDQGIQININYPEDLEKWKLKN